MLSGKATLTEIEMHWNLVDLADCHEALDIEGELQDWAQREGERKAKLKSKERQE